MSQDDVELRKLLAAYSGGDIVGFRTRFRTHEDQDQTLVNATGEELAVTYSEDTARFIAASVNYTRAALSAMPQRVSPDLIAQLTALASRLTQMGEYEAVDLIDTVVERVTAMPQRELLADALEREEGVALVHSTASPAVINPEKGWQAFYDGAIAQGHGDEEAREMADFYWAHPADVAEKRNAERKDRLHLVDMAGLFAEDYAREKLERDAEDDAVRLHKLATDRFEEIIVLKARLAEALEALEPFAAQTRASAPETLRLISRARAAADKIRAAMTQDKQ